MIFFELWVFQLLRVRTIILGHVSIKIDVPIDNVINIKHE